jgi:hypothetical protein
MLGSYGPSSDGKPYERPDFHTEDSPSGLLARQGTYSVRSKFVDDDGEIYAGALLLPTAFLPLTDGGWICLRLAVAIQARQGMVISL